MFLHDQRKYSHMNVYVCIRGVRFMSQWSLSGVFFSILSTGRYKHNNRSTWYKSIAYLRIKTSSSACGLSYTSIIIPMPHELIEEYN